MMRFTMFAILVIGAAAMLVAVRIHHLYPHRTSEASASAATATPTSAAGDWIGFHNGGLLTGDAGPLHAPPMKVRWKYKAGDDDPVPASGPTSRAMLSPPGHFEGGAAIVGGVVFTADSAGAVRAIDIATGKLRWLYQSDDGFETTPLVIKGRLFVGDLGGLFHAIDINTGKKAWTYDTNNQIHSSANYVGADPAGIVFGTDGADLYCLNADTGKVIWKAKAGDRINGTPAVVNGAVLVSGCDAELRAFGHPDGKELWSTEIGALAPGATAVAGDRLVIGEDQGRVICVSASAHKELWTFDKIDNSEMVYGSAAIHDGIAVVGSRDRKVRALKVSDGSQIWSVTTRGDVDSAPIISGGRVYVGSKDKKLYVLDLLTGKELWTFTAGRGIAAAPAIGANVLIFGDTGGNLFCLE